MRHDPRHRALPPAESFIEHLCETFEFDRAQATRALGQWMLETEAGRALVASFEAEERNQSSEAA